MSHHHFNPRPRRHLGIRHGVVVSSRHIRGAGNCLRYHHARNGHRMYIDGRGINVRPFMGQPLMTHFIAHHFGVPHKRQIEGSGSHGRHVRRKV